MRISAERKALLNDRLKALNSTVGGNMADINKAIAKCEQVMDKRIILDYNDYTNTWNYATLSEKALDENFNIVQ